MKQFFFGLLILALPELISAQQPSAPSLPSPPNDEAFKKQVEIMQQQMHRQMSMLHDSIAEWRRQLSESDAGREIKDALQDGLQDFKNELNMPPFPVLPPLADIPPVPEMQQAWGEILDELQDLHFRFEAPPAPDVPEPEAPLPPDVKHCP